MKRTLCDLTCGQCATVESIAAPGDMRARLMDLGLCRGCGVACVGQSPLGDPVAYRICGAILALRRADAQNVLLRP